LGGTHLITSGYGYIAIVVLVEETGIIKKKIIKPRLIYVKREFAITLQRLGIITQYDKELFLKGLSIIKFKQVTKKLKNLNIVLPQELELPLSELIILVERHEELTLVGLSITRKEEIIKEINNLSTLKPFYRQINLDQLNLIKMGETSIQLNVLNLIKEIKVSINVTIPNIYLLKQKQLAEYLKLIDLLDQIIEE